MADYITQTRTGVRGVNVKKCAIVSKDSKEEEQIAFTDIYYYESILNETIRANIFYVDTGRAKVRPTKEEKIILKLEDVNQNKIDLEQIGRAHV